MQRWQKNFFWIFYVKCFSHQVLTFFHNLVDQIFLLVFNVKFVQQTINIISVYQILFKFEKRSQLLIYCFILVNISTQNQAILLFHQSKSNRLLNHVVQEQVHITPTEQLKQSQVYFFWSSTQKYQRCKNNTQLNDFCILKSIIFFFLLDNFLRSSTHAQHAKHFSWSSIFTPNYPKHTFSLQSQ